MEPAFCPHCNSKIPLTVTRIHDKDGAIVTQMMDCSVCGFHRVTPITPSKGLRV